MGPYQFILILLGILPPLWALIKIGGWLRGKLDPIFTSEPVWEDYVDDVQSLEGATEVYPNKEENRIHLEYNKSEKSFLYNTKYDYEVLDFKKPTLMVEPLDEN